MLLDIVEVAKLHSGVNLAEAFANVLEEFGVSDKVFNSHNHRPHKLTIFLWIDPQCHLQ